MFPRDRKDFLKTKVSKGATIGANATIVCGNNIGRHSFIGAGAVVTKNTLDNSLMVGNPAKQIGWICPCGERLKSNNAIGKCPSCGKNTKQKVG
jgi:UDP-2-acetamido-3-amino-2,3-dideoxy-glucuronate N-acetyltransferase